MGSFPSQEFQFSSWKPNISGLIQFLVHSLLGKLSTRLKEDGIKEEGFCQSRAMIKGNVQLTPQYRAYSNCYHCCGGQNITYLFRYVPKALNHLNSQHTLKQFFHDHLKLPSYLNIDLLSVLIDITGRGLILMSHFHLPYILESNPHPNLIHTSFCRFLKRKKKLVRCSNPYLFFNRPLPTRQTYWIIFDVTNALTVIRCISNALDGSEDDILWEDDGEDKDDSDWVTDNDSIMSDDGESDE
jgi:hypothetical protein